jgi:aspartyl-tRNA(Asn)/glutamyl-tRNA(Gln) amidotransferase subunit C
MKIDITHVAKLANLTVTEKEHQLFTDQLSMILEHIKKLEEVDTSGVTPTSQVTGLENITREDKVTLSLTQKEALSGTNETHNGLFAVKGVFDNE